MKLLIAVLRFLLELLESKDLATMPYLEYLRTSAWQRKRKQRLALDSYKCQKCGEKKRLQVHHLTYKRRGYEKMSDLVTLCENCHKREHGL